METPILYGQSPNYLYPNEWFTELFNPNPPDNGSTSQQTCISHFTTSKFEVDLGLSKSSLTYIGRIVALSITNMLFCRMTTTGL